MIAHSASVRPSVPQSDSVDYYGASSLTDARGENAILIERRGTIAVKRPRKVQRCVAFQRETLSLGGVAGVQSVAKVERCDFRSDF